MDFITSSSQHFEIGAFITSTLHTTNTRHREIKELVQGHSSAGDGAGTEESSSQPPPWTDALLLLLCGCHQTEPCSWTGTNIPSSGRKSVSSQVSCTSCPFICSYPASHWCLSLSPATQRLKVEQQAERKTLRNGPEQACSGGGTAQCQVTECPRSLAKATSST